MDNILIIEDESRVSEVLKAYLEREGYRVYCTAYGMAGMEMFKSMDFNVIAEVKDNGAGIKKEDLPFIFERLYRGDKSRNQTEGNGIGLTIAKHILNLHNATIDAESEAGNGTSFKIYFDRNANN